MRQHITSIAQVAFAAVAGLMLEAAFGFFVPDDISNLRTMAFATGGVVLLLSAIGLGIWQERRTRKEDEERNCRLREQSDRIEEQNRQLEEQNHKNGVYLLTMVSMLRRLRDSSPSHEGSQKKAPIEPMRPIDSTVPDQEEHNA